MQRPGPEDEAGVVALANLNASIECLGSAVKGAHVIWARLDRRHFVPRRYALLART